MAKRSRFDVIVRSMCNRTSSTFLVIAAMVAVVLSACQSQTPSSTTRPAPKPAVTPIDDVVARLAAVSPDEARRQLTGFGFRPAAEASLSRSLTGNTLAESRSVTFFARSGDATIRDDFLGRVLRSQGRWSVRQGAVCHSVREGHEFCTGVFVRGSETLCWPGLDEVDTASVRRCTIQRGDQTG